MDTRTGRIIPLDELTLGDLDLRQRIAASNATKIARAVGLVPIPAGELEHVRKLNARDRIAWAERKEARRRQRNARKRQRRAKRR